MKGRYFIVVFLCLLAVPFQISGVSGSSDQNRAMEFLENVLPIDTTQWHIELRFDGNTTDIDARTDLMVQKHHVTLKDGDKALRYGLASMVGTADYLDILLIVKDNNFTQAIVDIDNAPSYSTYGRPLEVANVTNFLAKYQGWSGLDSAKMIEALSNVDLSQNDSVSSGNITMNINKIDSSTKLSWIFPDLRKFEVSFQNYFPTSFYDERQVTLISTPTPTITQHPTVNTGEIPPQADTFPTTVVIGSVLVVAVVGIGLLVYFKKSKHESCMS